MSALDPEVAAQLAEDLPPEVFRRIITTFEDDLGRLTSELQAAAAQGDTQAYLRAAHSLAGAAAAVGARRLEAEARIAMDARQPESAATLLPRLTAESTAALRELRILAGA